MSLCRVLTRILKIGSKNAVFQKKLEFYCTFLLRLCKKLESETKSCTPKLENLTRTLLWHVWNDTKESLFRHQKFSCVDSTRCNRPEFPPSQFFPRGKNRCNSLSCPPGQLAPPGGKLSRVILPPPWLSSPPGGKLSRPVYLAPHPYRGNNLIWCFQFICNILWYSHVFLKL